METKSKTNWGLVSAAFYASFQVISNVLSTKITILPIVNLAMDGGTILYPFTFTLRDFVHKTVGKYNSRVVVLTSGLISFLAMTAFWLVGKMPADPTWPYQEAYQTILIPVWRISVASIIAQVIAELIDTEIFSYVYKKLNDAVGVIISNFFALIIDSVIFTLIAFGGVLPIATVIEIIVSNILIKFIISLLSTPSIKLIPRKVEFEEI